MRPVARRPLSSRFTNRVGITSCASKGNQRNLRQAVAEVFDRAGDAQFAGCSMAEEVGEGHGRSEERYVTVVRKPKGMPEGWTDVRAVVLVGRERAVKGKANTSTAHYYITSLRCGAQKLAGYIRGHWESRTVCTGSWTCRFGKTTAGRGRATRVPTWEWFGVWRCRCCNGRVLEGASKHAG